MLPKKAQAIINAFIFLLDVRYLGYFIVAALCLRVRVQ